MKRTAQIAVMALLCGSVLQGSQNSDPGSRSHRSADPLKIVRMYADATGETHFETMVLPLVAGGGAIDALPATRNVRFNRYPADLKGEFHTCGCRMYLVVLSGGGLEIEVTDGSTTRLLPGSIMYFDDDRKPSKGQKGRAIDGETLVMYVTIAPQ
jgi:hypothetical protein